MASKLYRRQYYLKHRIELIKKNKEYSLKHREHRLKLARIQSKAYAKAHKQEIEKRKKEYYVNNKDRISESRRKWRAKHRQKFRDKQNIYVRTLKGMWLRGMKTAKQRNLIWNISLQDYALIRNRVCFYCEGILPEVGCGLDRIDNSRGYELDNVIPCCAVCNVSRGNRFTVEEMLEIKDWLIKCRKRREANDSIKL